MKKFIPYEKLSKKEKRKLDRARRQTWGELNPVTRKPANSKAYNRNKARNWKRDYHEPIPGFALLLCKSVFDPHAVMIQHDSNGSVIIAGRLSHET